MKNHDFEVQNHEKSWFSHFVTYFLTSIKNIGLIHYILFYTSYFMIIDMNHENDDFYSKYVK